MEHPTLCVGCFFVSLAIDSLDTSKLEILLNGVCSMQSLSDKFLFLFISFYSIAFNVKKL